jgi:hypothetical protein
MRRRGPRSRRKLSGIKGVDFVCCRICGDRLRVISRRHLSKHGTDRAEYMAEYALSPDKLVAKDFRVIQSSRRDYQPCSKKEWIAEMKRFYKKNGNVFARVLQQKRPQLYFQGKWLFGSWDKALSAAGFTPEKMRLHDIWDAQKVVETIRGLRSRGQQLNAYYAMKNYPALFLAGLRYYGEWGKALGAAGISNSSMLKNSTARRNLLKTLQEKTSEKPFAIGRSLKLQAELYFGSLQNALKQTKAHNL